MGNAAQVLKQNYTSPRWSMEICDCSMPMSFDTYSKCAYNCLYCFAFFQKSHTLKGYSNQKNAGKFEIRSVNPDRVKHLFESAFVDDRAAVGQTEQFPVHPG